MIRNLLKVYLTCGEYLQYTVLQIPQSKVKTMKSVAKSVAKSVTTSVRIKPHLRQELESLSANLGHGMNWFIEQALEEYLKKRRNELLIEEARKDILFLQSKKEDDSFWEGAYDDSGWV